MWSWIPRGSRDSAVGIATSYGAGRPRDRSSSSIRSKIFSSTRRSASYPMGTGAFSRRVMRPGREADHSPPLSVEVKKSGSIHTLDHTP
jgi:hypothetical protein